MTVSAASAAKRLCKKSGWTISNLKLQKLLYLAHMFHLGGQGEPLIDGCFEAWDYGPVEPSVYRIARVFGIDPIGNVFRGFSDINDTASEAKILDEVIDKLGHMSPSKLVAVTHWDDGAWAKYYVPGARNIIIPDCAIQAEYHARAAKAQERHTV